jgi:hypothetical protein
MLHIQKEKYDTKFVLSMNTKRMHCVILSLVACLAVPYFSTLSHKRQDFPKNVTERKMWVLILSTNLSKRFLLLRRIERDTIINVHWSSCEVPATLIRC